VEAAARHGLLLSEPLLAAPPRPRPARDRRAQFPSAFKRLAPVILRTGTLRVQTHPNSRLDELLPHEWKRLRAADSS